MRVRSYLETELWYHEITQRYVGKLVNVLHPPEVCGTQIFPRLSRTFNHYLPSYHGIAYKYYMVINFTRKAGVGILLACSQ
jgi:hypothetical protein